MITLEQKQRFESLVDLRNQDPEDILEGECIDNDNVKFSLSFIKMVQASIYYSDDINACHQRKILIETARDAIKHEMKYTHDEYVQMYNQHRNPK